jgi:ATP-dependent DNA helicase RecQ
VVQRTGWGKSIVYFLATQLLRQQGAGPTLLISPLLALMRNQVLMADRLGVRADTINSENRDEWDRVREHVLADQIDILLVSPERLSNESFRQEFLLPISNRIGLFVVDEAHCISDWGHDFRPDYRRIVRLLQALPPNIPVLATTATANDRVVNDVVTQLGRDLQVVRGGLGRSSLCLQNIHLPTQGERLGWLADNLSRMPGSGIIYTLTIRDSQRVAAWLQSCGLDVREYWSGLTADARVDLENKLLNNEIKALAATTALGMGFDKPDLGFVIHYQRPGSVVHYYQQVGRAGRAIENAYGVLLNGQEDQGITDYFIQTAFPPQAHVNHVLATLEDASDGLSIPMIEARLNLGRTQIEKVLKLLSVESPSPVIKEGLRWYRSPVPYALDVNRIQKLAHIRQAEQVRMHEYMRTSECLMQFLQRELDDPAAKPCGRCANCVGHPLLPVRLELSSLRQAAHFLRRCPRVLTPRKLWETEGLPQYGWHGRIGRGLAAEEGRALCWWGDAGWGELVRRGKQEDGRFDESLVCAAANLISSIWNPVPPPVWVTCVPSLRHPELVADLAQRLAEKLQIPFRPAIRQLRLTRPQKEMMNSYQQTRNLDGAFEVDRSHVAMGPVLLVDDVVDSRWTFTIISALLRQAGVEAVYPLALADARMG